MGNPAYRRKNYFINKKFQFGFFIRFIALLFIESILIAGLLLAVSGDTITTGFQDSILTVERTQNFFFIPVLLIILIVMVGISLAGMVVFTLVSHKIAGPLYRFEQVLKKLGEGDFTADVQLRSQDQLVEVQKELNVLIGSLDQRMGRIKRGFKEVESLLVRKDDPEMIHQLQEKIRHLQQEINHFKVSTDVDKG